MRRLSVPNILLAVICLGAGLAATAQSPPATPAPDAAGRPEAVRVWTDTVTLPTYEEGPPDPNAPFDLFTSTRFSYPYTVRDRLTATRALRAWRRLNLENQYLRCSVLPDLGGHLYTCTDKVNGRDLFYANTSIKLANVAYRGAWAAFGIEFNFPVSHNWMTVSPVDYATVREPDGGASIWIGNIDRVYGGQWRVALTLRPNRAVLEQHTSLYNASPARHRFYWWTNAAVRVGEDSRMIYPMRFTASHGFTEIDTWPIDHRGVDLSTIRTHTAGPVSLFSHGSREPFMAVYHPATDSGVAHYSSPADLPAKKFWSWGNDQDAKDWRVALSDDNSPYVEVQAGLFRNQETYAFLEPQETIAFDEYWLPLRDTGGLVRATRDAALNLTRDGRTLTAALTVTRPVGAGRLRLLQGSRVVAQERITTDPAHVLRRTWRDAPAEPCTLELSDAGGVLVSHTEDEYDWTPATEIRPGPQPAVLLPPAADRTEAQVVEGGRDDELEGRRLDAYRAYTDALERFPDSVAIRKAAGRLALQLQRADEALAHLSRASARVTNDPEIEYYLGQAYLLRQDDQSARAWLERAQHRAAFRAPALFELARIAARAGALADAAALLDTLRVEAPRAVRPGLAHVAVLRHLGRTTEARRHLAAWRLIDPTSNALRVESDRLGSRDPALWTHMASDPERLLETATDYMALGFFNDAADLLARPLPSGPEVVSEPGTPPASANPLVAYYRAYCRLKAGQSPAADFAAASRMPTTYIFPSRASTLPVLEAALAANPDDTTAAFLVGSLHLSRGTVQPALDAWSRVLRDHPRIAGLHRNVGLTYLLALHQPEKAAPVLRDGLEVDPTNVGLYVGLDQALSLLERPASERAVMLSRYPDAAAMPTTVSFKLALALAEAGRFDEAEQAFAHRFFPREEGGTNVRQVYLEVRVLRAQDAALHDRCTEAQSIVDHLGEPVAGLAFTRDGLDAFLGTGRMRYILAGIAARCGAQERARTTWQALESTATTFPFIDVAYAYRSAARLCDASGGEECRDRLKATWTPRLEQALSAATRHLEQVGTSFPGTIRCAQGLLLVALGRPDEARQRFRDALLAPDRLLSHHLAREGLAELGAEPRPATGVSGAR